jgi:hypothetical protein
MPDAFIWYHAGDTLEPDLPDWIDQVGETTGIRGRLFVRRENDRTTFMEIYSAVSGAMIERIESMAAQQPVFEGIDRRCESFTKVPRR